MSESKGAEFSQTEQKLAQYARALSHPARIAILKLLASRKTCICGELVDELPLSQATVSQHLKALKSAGLIQGTISGPKTCYCLDPLGVKQLSKIMPQFLAKLESRIEKTIQCC
ncbi:MAG: winged helix-turn-helix transcriptional regulator [Deltaproteobacteria bacterium]|nr:winged helix-turn-helix transcriptional regulator [Deltaproteobacteria bacterium]